MLTHCASVLQRVAGKDASKQFWKYHNESILKKYKGKLLVGSLDSKKPEALPPTPPATPPPAEKKSEPKEQTKPQPESGVIAPVPGKDVEEVKESMDPYGAMIPYADPSWYQSVCIMPSFENTSLTYDPSITPPISTRHMPLYAPKSVNGLTARSNLTSRNGMKPRKCQIRYTSRWASGATWQV